MLNCRFYSIDSDIERYRGGNCSVAEKFVQAHQRYLLLYLLSIVSGLCRRAISCSMSREFDA